eukprot:TRINITY_DN74297_c0_g1_i1.p1 TRINITY_DN74297_c0_g1~~TRINITY_DN74297_c0_g1_i1.p1  ORF type:complete len:253 (+),score=107.39 TRINITY_DN74297_c0_g1_i1:72-830(+)
MSGQWLLLAALVACSIPSCGAFSFFIRPNAYTCFTEELPSQRTLIHIDFKAGDAIAEAPILLEVISPKGKTIHSAKLDRRDASVQVHAQGIEGPHSICLLKEGVKPVRVDLQVDSHMVTTGDWVEHKDPSSGRFFYHNPKTKESVWNLPAELTQRFSVKNVKAEKGKESNLKTTQAEMELYANYMKALQAMMDQIHDESATIIERQVRFKETTDSTSNTLWWLSFFQVCLCALIPMLQSFQLKRMLISKKVV